MSLNCQVSLELLIFGHGIILSTLLQGGPFDSEEVAEFQLDPLFQQKVAIRRWDDAAKEVDYRAPLLETYRESVLSCLLSRSN